MAEIRQLTAEPQLIDETKTIERAVIAYEMAFLKMVDLYEVLGQANDGQQGKIRQKAKEIQSIIQARKADRLSRDLVNLRGIETDFSLQPKEEDVKIFAEEINRFKAHVGAAGLPFQLQKQLLDLAGEYVA